jgi:2-amino-4-hydroxy-6-hydroxymethyldihydropteridine diphosphokinase
MPKVFVSVGSNIDTEKNIRQAFNDLKSEFGELFLSSVYRSPAVGFNGDDFLNLIIGFATNRSPYDCAAVMTRIEDSSGRTKQQHGFTARPLDLDMVVFGDLVDSDQSLRLPRNDVDKYAFVLAPLAEVAPKFLHPVSGKSFSKLWSDFDKTDVVMQIEPFDFKV